MATRKRERKRPTLSAQLRQAVVDSELTRYRISKETGINAAQLCRFVKGEAWLGSHAFDRLGELLNLNITVQQER